MVTSSNPTPPASADWLDALLVSDAGDHRAGYVSDDGFTARVMQRLPALGVLPAWRRPVVAGLWIVAAVLVAMMLPGAALDIARQAFTLFAARPFSLSTLAFAIVAVGIATWTGAALALRRD